MSSRPNHEWSGIAYRDFWDVPRAIVTRRGDQLYYFYSRFDETLDAHVDHYEVWRLLPLDDARLAGSWIGLEELALERLPDIPLNALAFEVPRRS